MAGFKTHITTSSVLGVGYAGLGLHLGIPWESSVLAGGLCGIGGMLPDIDSDSGIPYRESMCFMSAIIPAMMLDRFRELGLNYEQFVLAIGGMYLLVRFGVGRLISKYTVHRGMFHSIPAALIFAGATFLISKTTDLNLRYFKAAGVFLGVMSHLVLDEIYAVEWKRGRWRFKKSFGTAIKLWSKSSWSNFSTYAKLVLIILMILGEPMVMERYGEVTPLAIDRREWKDKLTGNAPPALLATNPGDPTTGSVYPPGYDQETGQPLPDGEQPSDQILPPKDRDIYDTARRIWTKLHE